MTPIEVKSKHEFSSMDIGQLVNVCGTVGIYIGTIGDAVCHCGYADKKPAIIYLKDNTLKADRILALDHKGIANFGQGIIARGLTETQTVEESSPMFEKYMEMIRRSNTFHKNNMNNI